MKVDARVMFTLMMSTAISVGKVQTGEGKSNRNNANSDTDDWIRPRGRSRWVDLIRHFSEMQGKGIRLDNNKIAE